MKKQERLDLYRKLACHPKFVSLPERLQEALSYMAAGYTDRELKVMYKISHGTPWSYRECIFRRYGFKVYDPTGSQAHRGVTRVMTQEEIKKKYDLKGGEKKCGTT